MMTPELFTRAHCYVLFWSGGQGGRSTTSMELWDAMDCEFAGMTHEQAKQCFHNRLQVAGQLDHARAKTALDKAAASVASGAVPRLSQDSSDSEGESGRDAEQRRRPARRSLDEMVRSENDVTEESSNLPLIVHPKSVPTRVARGRERTGWCSATCAKEIYTVPAGSLRTRTTPSR